MSPRSRSERGMALLITLLAAGLFASVTGGLTLSAVIGRGVSANYEEAAALANAAESALMLAARELAGVADWDEVLAGAGGSTLVDGAPGLRMFGGRSIDLPAITNEATCALVNPCTDAQVRQTTAERPWGMANPRWRLFVHAPLPAAPAPRPASPTYVVVWIGDDARETDGDPARDGAGAGQEGRYVVRARALAFGERGGRYVIEAELLRVCTAGAGGETCLPGLRVQSWRTTPTIP